MSQTLTSLSLLTLETEQYHTYDFQNLSHGLLCDPLVYKNKRKSIYAVQSTVTCPIQNNAQHSDKTSYTLIIKVCYIMRRR